MGWSGGSEILSAVAEAVKDNVNSAKAREKIYREIIPEFEQHDCDTMDECEGVDPALDKVLREFELVYDEEPEELEEGDDE